MWDLIKDEYSKKYGIGCATFKEEMKEIIILRHSKTLED